MHNKCHYFHQLGYDSVREDELMNYLVSYRWKKQMPVSLKACKEDISAINPNDFFDYQQLVAQTSSYAIKDWHDLEDLF